MHIITQAVLKRRAMIDNLSSLKKSMALLKIWEGDSQHSNSLKEKLEKDTIVSLETKNYIKIQRVSTLSILSLLSMTVIVTQMMPFVLPLAETLILLPLLNVANMNYVLKR